MIWYTSMDLSVSEKIAASFKEKFGGIDVRVERTGAERVFQRIGQEVSPATSTPSTSPTPPTRRT